jgi:cytochrome c oxidase cbb3-type subunit 3
LKVRVLTFLLLAAASAPADTTRPGEPGHGKGLYDYYCYQCHAYAGTGDTLAARYLNPPPRDFTGSDPGVLTRSRMLQAVTDGRPGTAMKSFARVLDPLDRDAVVDYIRQEFMTGEPSAGRYHTTENGWPDHREKYALAYPFAIGEIATDRPVSAMSDEERSGFELFRTSCVSCHDRGKVENEGPVWRARASSYPRRHYDHRLGPWDAETSATPYQRHDVAPDVSGEPAAVQAGQQVFLDNCAFCHGADGTGKNWIGSFLDPPAADLTGLRIASWPPDRLRQAILAGVPGGTMPAWRGLLDERQLSNLLAYLNSHVVGHALAGREEGAGGSPGPYLIPKWEKD